jgi:hypothetical protein
MSELQAIIGQLFIVEGTVQTIEPGKAVPGLLAQPAPAKKAHSRDKDFLFVHLSLTGPLNETADLTQTLLLLISQTFYNSSGSITAAMRTAILAANQQLLRHNVSSGATAREGAITCVTFRQDELFTLQSGESFALLGRNYGLERMPAQPPAILTPLGRSSGLDFRFYHHRLSSGDMLLLGDPRISHLATEDFQPALVDSQIEYGLAQLQRLVGEETARLLLVEFNADDMLDAPDVQAIVPTIQSETPVNQPRRETAVAVTTMNGRKKSQPRTTPDKQPLDRDALEHNARRAGSTTALGASRFVAWFADLLARLRPPQQEATPPVNTTAALLIAITIPILIGLIVTGVYLERGRVQRMATVKSEMGQYLSQAEEASSDPTQARLYYNQVIALAAEADVQLRPGDAQVTSMRETARTELDRLDGISRLNAQPFYQYSTGTNLKAVSLRDGFNGGVFTIDQASGIAYEHETDETYLQPLTDEPLRIAYPGQAIGNHIVGRLVDLFWRPQGVSVTRDGMAMLDTAGALLTFQPNLDSTFAIPLDLSSEWVNPVAMADFDERIYILDPGAGVIWKYFPNGDDFVAKADERTLALPADADLAQAIDFDIYSEDGSVVLLYGDGRIRYYDTRSGRLVWDEQAILANGLNTPLQTPTAVEIVGRGLNATIFIADAGNGRIIQVGRPTGQVLAQYKATAADGTELFTNMTDFAVAELPLRIFVTIGDTLYTATQN